MTTWTDLTPQEQAALVSTARARDTLRRINRLAWDHGTDRHPYDHLRALGLIQEVRRSKTHVTYTITPAAATLLLAAPDDPGANDFFPLAINMTAVKDKLHKQGFRLEE